VVWDNRISSCLDVLVDDAPQEIVPFLLEEPLAVGETRAIRACVRSRLGAWMPEIPVALSSSNSLVVRTGRDAATEGLLDALTGVGEGTADMTMQAQIGWGLLQGLVSVKVVKDRLEHVRLVPGNMAVACGQALSWQVEGFLRSGTVCLLSREQVEMNADKPFRQTAEGLVFDTPGRIQLQVKATLDGVTRTDTCSVYAIRTGSLPDGVSLCAWGTAEGFAGAREGTMVLAGTGENVWFHRDDALYLYREETGEPLSVLSCRIVSLEKAGPFTQFGLMLREDTSAEAACIHLRVDADGGVMAGYRAASGEGMTGLYLTGRQLQLPLFLRMAREGDWWHLACREDAAEIGASKPWIAVGSLRLPVGEQALAGLALFSNNRAAAAVGVADGFHVETRDKAGGQDDAS
jgi:hypothetical protein